jgi:hypothetical protein
MSCGLYGEILNLLLEDSVVGVEVHLKIRDRKNSVVRNVLITSIIPSSGSGHPHKHYDGNITDANNVAINQDAGILIWLVY